MILNKKEYAYQITFYKENSTVKIEEPTGNNCTFNEVELYDEAFGNSSSPSFVGFISSIRFSLILGDSIVCIQTIYLGLSFTYPENYRSHRTIVPNKVAQQTHKISRFFIWY